MGAGHGRGVPRLQPRRTGRKNLGLGQAQGHTQIPASRGYGGKGWLLLEGYGKHTEPAESKSRETAMRRGPREPV